MQQKRERQSLILRSVGCAALLAAMVVHPVYAQNSLKQVGVSVFTAIYAVVGVLGAIALVIAGLNWALGNPFGVHDPKRLFFQVLLGIGIAFGSVALIQFLKDTVGDSSGSIGNL
jgi:MFS-type transporter involved in bile tolerance (Atg22 family)